MYISHHVLKIRMRWGYEVLSIYYPIENFDRFRHSELTAFFASFSAQNLLYKKLSFICVVLNNKLVVKLSI